MKCNRVIAAKKKSFIHFLWFSVIHDNFPIYFRNFLFQIHFPRNAQVITIFSASNYYEIGSNKGAYLKLNPQLDTHFVQYTAAASKTRKLTFRQKVGLVESSAIRELGAKLRNVRNELDREFKVRDPDLKGIASTDLLFFLFCILFTYAFTMAYFLVHFYFVDVALLLNVCMYFFTLLCVDRNLDNVALVWSNGISNTFGLTVAFVARKIGAIETRISTSRCSL